MNYFAFRDNKRTKTINKFRKDEDKSILKLSKLSNLDQNTKLAEEYIQNKKRRNPEDSLSQKNMSMLSNKNITKYSENNQNAIEEQKESEEGSASTERNNIYKNNNNKNNNNQILTNNDNVYKQNQENENFKNEANPSSNKINRRGNRSKSILLSQILYNRHKTNTNINNQFETESNNYNDTNKNDNYEIPNNQYKKNVTIENKTRNRNINNKSLDMHYPKFSNNNISLSTNYGVKFKKNSKKIKNKELNKVKTVRKIKNLDGEFDIILYYEGKHQELKIPKDAKLSDLLTLIRRKLCPYYKLENYKLLYKLKEIDFQKDQYLSEIIGNSSDVATFILKKIENSPHKNNYKDTTVFIENFPSFTDLAEELNKFFEKETRESYFDMSYKGNICKVSFTSSEKAFSLIIFLTTLKTKNPIYKRLKVNLDYKLKVVTNVNKTKQKPIKLVLPLLELSHDSYSLDKKNRLTIFKDDKENYVKTNEVNTIFSNYIKHSKKSSSKKEFSRNSVDDKISKIKKYGRRNTFLNVLFNAIDNLNKDNNSEKESEEDKESDYDGKQKINKVLLEAKSKKKIALRAGRKK